MRVPPQKGLESSSQTKFFFLGWQAARSIGIVTSSARCQKAGMPKYALILRQRAVKKLGRTMLLHYTVTEHRGPFNTSSAPWQKPGMPK